MDLSQQKLTKKEWEGIEIPSHETEKRINKLIIQGFNDVSICQNDTLSLLNYLKIAYSQEIDNYVYCTYLQKYLLHIAKKNELNIDEIKCKNATIKKRDLIRFSNTDKNLEQNKDKLFEFIIIHLLKNLFSNKKLVVGEVQDPKPLKTEMAKQKVYYYYYTLKRLLTYTIELCNVCFIEHVKKMIDTVDADINIAEAVYYGYEIIEKNDYLLRYADEKLYEHQKQLFTLCKQPNPKLITYIAPTGTGKTLSPLGLSENFKIIFVCAARHVGLALARAAISERKKVAFAFGCGDAQDIRLHYYSVKECIRNKRNGVIKKVDNSIGDNVEIMISDIKSYLPAMYYMLAFNKRENIILYWDEPTITMDYQEHAFHQIIAKNWRENLIPNVVLSSATLPQPDEMIPTFGDFRKRFDNATVHTILSYDCKKTIPIFTKEGYVVMPHLINRDYIKVKDVVNQCKKSKTLLRYIDLFGCIKLIKYVNENNYLTSKRYEIQRHFPTIESVTMENIEIYYLDVLNHIKPENWDEVYQMMSLSSKTLPQSYIKIVSEDSHTLTDGPTIYLANDVDKIAKYCLKSANIPNSVLKDIMSAILFNADINEKIAVIQKQYEDGTKKDDEKDKKESTGRVSSEMRHLLSKINDLQGFIKTVELNPVFIPNSFEHKRRFKSLNVENTFTCDIDQNTVEQIMLIDDIEDIWKLLLLMGIGVFTSHKSIRYTEIMKYLAYHQKLYLIIASDDYIYGTSYQFCHAYIGKDLGDMSKEKLIQAMGRAGRNKLQQTYSIRFRDNGLITKLFTEESVKPEVENMARLFNT